MKILSAEQTRSLDQYTIEHEPIAPINLMERASQAFTQWFTDKFDKSYPIKIFCGLGNNGGDGLAIARMLLQLEYNVQTYIVRYAPRESDDCMINHKRLKLLSSIHYLENPREIPNLKVGDVVIDAIFGTGLSRPVEGIVAATVEAINQSPATVVSVDIATGLYADSPIGSSPTIIEPDYTITFQLPKLAFFLPSNARYVGEWHVLNIGLNQGFIDRAKSPIHYVTESDARQLLRTRDRFSHKGTYGHALLLAGSYGKMGAAVLASRACLRSGVGLLTVQTPHSGYTILQTAVPEAMCRPDDHADLLTGRSRVEGLAWKEYSAIGVGPGIGKSPETRQMLIDLLADVKKPMVLDADALNLLAENRELIEQVPERSILTPHPKEFERLTRGWSSDYDKLGVLREFAIRHQLVVVLKGAYTATALPDGSLHFNSTGNPGMATGGTGDVLTGILTALLAQGYDPAQAALLGVFKHGQAGDLAAERRSQAALTASDLIEHLSW